MILLMRKEHVVLSLEDKFNYKFNENYLFHGSRYGAPFSPWSILVLTKNVVNFGFDQKCHTCSRCDHNAISQVDMRIYERIFKV